MARERLRANCGTGSVWEHEVVDGAWLSPAERRTEEERVLGPWRLSVAWGRGECRRGVLPVPAGEARSRLLSRTTGGGPDDMCARYLNEVEEFRGQFDAPKFETVTSQPGFREGMPILERKKASLTPR